MNGVQQQWESYGIWAGKKQDPPLVWVCRLVAFTGAALSIITMMEASWEFDKQQHELWLDSLTI